MKSFSIIIPVHNESKILDRQVKKIISGVNRLHLPVNYEIILAENGSTDGTCIKAKKLSKRYRNVRNICLPFPSYGQAFKEGIRKASNPYIFQFDIDFWDTGFIKKSLVLLDKYDFVIGSKNLNHSVDKRPLLRKLISRILEKIINLRFNVSLTDTHGLKALKKETVEPLLKKTVCSNHFFDSELLLRMISKGSQFVELPVNLTELRSSRFPFLIRFKEVLNEFITLMSIRLEKPLGTVPAWGLSPIEL